MMAVAEHAYQLRDRRAHWRDERARSILGCIASVDGDWSPQRLPQQEGVRFAVLNQIFKALLEYQRRDDFSGALEYLREFDCAGAVEEMSWGGAVVCGTETAWHVDSDEYLSDCFLLPAPTPRVADPPRLKLLSDAAALLPSDFLSLIGPMPGVLALRVHKIFEDGMNSYALSDIYSSIYLDTNESRLRTAETILHEASHCWLTEVLQAFQIDLEGGKHYFSPWKGVERPAFGMLHATVIFAVLAVFFRRMAEDPRLSELEQRYCAVRIEMERANLRDSKASFQEICSDRIQDEAVRATLIGIFNAGIGE